MDSKPLNASKLIISRSKPKLLLSWHEHKAGYYLWAFVSFLQGRTWVAEGILLGFHRQYFQIKINLIKRCRLFSLVWFCVCGGFFCCVCFLGFPRGGLRNQVESAGSAGRRNVESVGPGGAGHRQGFSPVLFPLLSVCAWISLFFAAELLPTLVGIHGFLGNLCWPVPEENLRNALIFCMFLLGFLCAWEQYFSSPGGCLFPDAVPDLCFPFRVLDDVAFGCVVSLQIWSSGLVFPVLTELKGPAC